MALSKITYDNKETLVDQPSIANKNKCSANDLNEIKSVVNAGIDTINGDGTMGDIIVDSIRTKNMFDKSTLVQGDIVDAFPTLRITSRQVIWLEAGTYTASSNLTSTYQWGIQIQNVGTLPLSSYPTYIYETGWQTAGTTEKTFTINTAGWYNLMIRRSDNGAFTNTDLTNIYSANYQLEKGEEATTYTPYQNLTGINEIYLKSEVQIGTWIDGKPLYRRILEDTLGTTNAGWKSIQLTSSNYIKKVISITAMFEFANGNDYSIPFFRGTDDNYANREYCLCNINPANGEFAIIARHPSNYALISGQPFYAIILYTKSSDYS